MARRDLLLDVCKLIGQPIVVVDAAIGWPGHVRVQTETGEIDVALHVSRTGSHARKPYERRFQNPADRTPVSDLGRMLPLLVGLENVDGQPILVTLDGRSRVDRIARFSILFDQRLIVEASINGWGDYVSNSGEHIVALRPSLFPVFVEAVNSEVIVPVQTIVEAGTASGVLDVEDDNSAERARRAGSSLVRDARFSQDVRRAYNSKCAMCELNLGLVVGAHVYPASAPGAQDEVWNGMALCHNHHGAFDNHKIWIAADYRLRMHDDYLKEAEEQPSAQRFVEGTRSELLLPAAVREQPRTEMFERRYQYFANQYDWANQ